MATITKVTLRERVAKHLRVKARDMELDAGVAADIDEVIDDTREQLREKGLMWWPENAIPQSTVNALKLIISAYAAGLVGKSGQGYEAALAEGLAQLAELKQTADIMPVSADYF